jgi:hypothetical protein
MKRSAKPAKKKSPKTQLPKASEQMREFAAMLTAELERWPRVSTKPMFGFAAVYRGAKIFAALPKTRALVRGDGLMFKLQKPSASARRELGSDSRIVPTDFAKSKWFAMEVLAEKDLRDALRWLERAYEAAV